MTWTQFKTNAVNEIKSYYYIRKANKYIKEAHRMLKIDRDLSLAFKALAEVYEKKSKSLSVLKN